MSINLTFHQFKDRQPKDDEEIWVIERSKFYGSYDFRFGTAEYCWDEVDESGNYTGTSYIPEEGMEIPSDCRLSITFNGKSMQDDDLWASCEEMEKSFPEL